jgi:FkbM family methyltransferase
MLLRLLPPRLRMSAFARLYWPVSPKFLPLYDAAPLHFAPHVKLRLLPGDWVSDSVAMTGIYDLFFERLLLKLAARGGLMVDVGANVGLFSLLWAAARPDNRVIAFEPSPRALPFLRENIERNGLGDRIEVREQAAGDTEGPISFDLAEWHSIGSGRMIKGDRPIGDTTTVESVRLEHALAGCGPIDLLKIDAEGFDGYVIKGAEALLKAKQVRHIWMEEYIYVLGRVLLREWDYSWIEYETDCFATPN